METKEKKKNICPTCGQEVCPECEICACSPEWSEGCTCDQPQE